MAVDWKDACYNLTNSSEGFDDPDQASNTSLCCRKKSLDALQLASGITSAIGIVFTITTLLTILSHRPFRKKRFIFPFNIVLADCVVDVTILVYCIRWSVNTKVDLAVRNISFVASHLVSFVNILLVAVDQVIVFKLDPFGVKNILTQTRRIVICILTWVIMIGLSLSMSSFENYSVKCYARFYACTSSVVLTVFCCFLAYRAVSKPLSSGNTHGQKARKEKT